MDPGQVCKHEDELPEDGGGVYQHLIESQAVISSIQT